MKKMIDPVFLSTIIGDFSGITLEVCCEFDANQSVMTQHSSGIVLLVIIVNLREDSKIRAEIRCTILPDKLQVTCGPHSITVGFTAYEAEPLSDFLMQAREWMHDFFSYPEGMDKTEIPPPLVRSNKGFMWSIEEFLQHELMSRSHKDQPATLN
jgi:hypothetical protein